MISIKDYIISNDKIRPDIVTNGGVTYSIVYEADTDFIISRKSAKSERELVVLPSQNTAYLSDSMPQSDIKEPISLESLKRFFDKFNGRLQFKNLEWLNYLTRANIDQLHNIITVPVKLDMIRHHVLNQFPEISDEDWRRYKKVLLYIKEKNIPKHKEYLIYELIRLACKIYDDYSYNVAQYAIDSFCQSSYVGNLNQIINCLKKLKEKDIAIDIRKLLDYLFVSFYRQGLQIDFHNVYEYTNYLQLQKDYYGNVGDYYPNNLLTVASQMRMRREEFTQVENCSNFKTRTKAYQNLAWCDSEGDYAIALPHSIKALIDLSISHGYSIVSDIKDVDEGKYGLLLLTHGQETESEILVVKVCDVQVLSVTGNDHRPLTEGELTFLHSWANEKRLLLPKAYQDKQMHAA